MSASPQTTTVTRACGTTQLSVTLGAIPAQTAAGVPRVHGRTFQVMVRQYASSASAFGAAGEGHAQLRDPGA
jgi:hypothetical protein